MPLSGFKGPSKAAAIPNTGVTPGNMWVRGKGEEKEKKKKMGCARFCNNSRGGRPSEDSF
jgi:hypothetical protein